jgi:hypothetical protein
LTTQAEDAVSLTISIVAISIVLHGVTAQPILSRYEKMIKTESE